MKSYALLFLSITNLLLFLSAKDKVNVVLIFADDQGYGIWDALAQNKTPNIDQMAKEGRKFTNFMVASPVCTPSHKPFLPDATLRE